MLLRLHRQACLKVSRGWHRSYSLLGAPIDVSPEVQHALQHGSPVVALESTIITHGMPHPTNLQTALSVESKVRSTGSIPATIGVLAGRVVVGLQRSQLEILADGYNLDLVKLSRRDLAAAVGLGKSGGTTIAATSLIASLVGIPIFATGGLGGVHRGGEISWDVSADLTELGRTPIAVVSAGVKSILDIGRTLEYLETQGVTVITYGPTSEFPGFYGPKTGYQSPWRVDSPETAAEIISAGQRLGLKSGILFAAPIPDEHAGAAEGIQAAVDRAVRESEENGISKRGKEATPWILRRVGELTQGRSIPSNIALIENTAYIAGRIAAEYAKLQPRVTKESSSTPVLSQPPPPAALFVIGAAAIDVISQPTNLSAGQTLPAHSTHPGKVTFSPGGVARNIAEAAHRISSSSSKSGSHEILLVSPIGDDLVGSLIVDNARKLGMRTDGFLTGLDRTLGSAVCNMHLDIAGSLTTGVADMSIVEAIDSHSIVDMINAHRPRLVAFDANLKPDVISSLVQFCSHRQIPTFFEPTSVPKSGSILHGLTDMTDDGRFVSSPVTFASPNQLELSQLFQEIQSSPHDLTSRSHWWSIMDDLGLAEQYRSDLTLLSKYLVSTSQEFNLFQKGIPQMAISLLPFFQHLFIKCGEMGVFVAMRIVGEAALSGDWSHERTRPDQRQLVSKGKSSILVLKHYPAIPINREDIVNVTGAGDSFVGSLLTAIGQNSALNTPQSLDEAVECAQNAARLSLFSADAISPLLCSAVSKRM
ncbi:indigoidine synthase A-like protein [Gautieria morchelliformis]|nr:indigoidine synthase A-like protein [Gautieria morchelliformis]